MKQPPFPLRCLLLLPVLAAAHSLCTPATAQPGVRPTPSDPVELEARTFTDSDDAKKSLPYRFLTPGMIEKDKRYPLLVCLHGLGSSGDDNKRPVETFQPLFTSATREKYPCFAIVPQCPRFQKWATFGSTGNNMKKDPTPTMALVKALVEETLKKHPVDPRRVYVTGHSMGGFGTFEFVQRWPEMTAAAAPLASGGDVKYAEACKDVPMWVFHGAKDVSIDPERSKAMVDALKAAGGKPKFTLYPDAEHSIAPMVYGDPSLLEWMFAQRKPDAKEKPKE